MLSVLSVAFAQCVISQAMLTERLGVQVKASGPPGPCQHLTFQSSQPLEIEVFHLPADGVRYRLSDEHQALLPGGGWEVGVPELRDGEMLQVEVSPIVDDLVVRMGSVPVRPPGRRDEERTLTLGTRKPAQVFAEPWRGETLVVSSYQLANDGALLPIPAEAEDVLVTGDAFAVPLGVRPASGARALSVSYVLPGATAQAEEWLPPGSLSLRGAGVTWISSVDPGITVTPLSDGVRFSTETGGMIRYRVGSVGDAPVIPDADVYIGGLLDHFRRVSLPEPAVPIRLRGMKDRALLLASLLAEVQGPATGALPGRDPLDPRPLNKAWRSGWLTPLERGLILRAMLLQERFDARLVLTGDAPDAVSLTGYDTPLILLPGGWWVDPNCTMCGPQEVSTRWMGRPAIGGATVVPRQPGLLTRHIRIVGTTCEVRYTADGAAALWLREQLVDVVPEERAAILARSLGMAGAEVVEVTGLEVAGGPAAVLLRGGAPDDILPDGTPWEGGVVDAL